MNGTVGVLSVGAGDTKLVFDKDNPADTIRAARIVKDMIRRGYALLIEVERDGVKKFERALDFDENTHEYIIADFDPVVAAGEDEKEEASAPKRGSKRIGAGSTRAVAVARTAGG